MSNQYPEPVQGRHSQGGYDAAPVTTLPRPEGQDEYVDVELRAQLDALPAPVATIAPVVPSPVTPMPSPAPALPRRLRTSDRPPIVAGVQASGHTTHRGDIAVTIAGIGLGIAVGIGVFAVKDTVSFPGGWTRAAGTMTALVGTYLCLALLVLVSRMPWLEREVGHDRMVKFHRSVAPYSLVLIFAHVVLTTLGYAQGATSGFLATFWSLVSTSSWMMPALAAFVLMMGLGVISYRRIRSRMKYETWWVAHLYFYIAVVLSLGHQIALGPMFTQHPAQRLFWIGLYIAVAAMIIISRFVIPISTSLHHDFRVAAVVPEADGVVSVYITGKDLDLIRARGGQFYQWRFMTREWWWQAHPYSLSASPNGSWLRITVKGLGDQSSKLSRLHVGTRVLAEGPYGVFTAAARHGENVTLFAAGVGITPVRAVFEDLPSSANVTLVYRCITAIDAPLRTELDALAVEKGFRVLYLEGARHDEHPLTVENLTAHVPGLGNSDVYVCGPPPFTAAIVATSIKAGVPEDRIHHEAFSF
jgi:predicted ferric reductase